jgi:hypothetical protein
MGSLWRLDNVLHAAGFEALLGGRVALDIASKGDDLSFLTIALRVGTCSGQAIFK